MRSGLRRRPKLVRSPSSTTAMPSETAKAEVTGVTEGGAAQAEGAELVLFTLTSALGGEGREMTR